MPGPSITPRRTTRTLRVRRSSGINTTLVEEAEDLATGVLAASLLMVHDAEGGGQYDVSELRLEQESTAEGQIVNSCQHSKVGPGSRDLAGMVPRKYFRLHFRQASRYIRTSCQQALLYRDFHQPSSKQLWHEEEEPPIARPTGERLNETGLAVRYQSTTSHLSK